MSEATIETRKYLNHISTRMAAYQKVRLRTLDYLEEMEITNVTTMANCIVMSFLWLAAVRNEILTEREILIHLNMDDSLTDDKEMMLDPEIAEMGFNEALDYCLMNMESDDD